MLFYYIQSIGTTLNITSEPDFLDSLKGEKDCDRHVCWQNSDDRIYQRKHEILRPWEGGDRGFGFGHSNADFVHLIQQAESGFFLIVADGSTKQTKISDFFQQVKMKLKS